jgi:hypothetical protein
MAAVRTQPDTLEAALEYLARGWSVIPLCCPLHHEDYGPSHAKACSRIGKQPLIPWTTYQERLPRPNEIKLLWKRWEHVNVGVVLGKVSSLIGVDIDGPEAEDLWEEHNGPLEEPTFGFTTPGGGRRLVYALPRGLTVPKRRFDRGGSHLIILGEGSYSVMPPSIHPNGETYRVRDL